MVQQLFLVEDILAHDGQEFLLYGYIILEDEEPKFALHLEMRERSSKSDAPFMSVDINYSIENPLIEGGIVIGAASAYASCLAYAGFKFGVKAVKRCYADSKRSNPHASHRERAKEVAECLSSQGKGAKDAITDALLDCIPFKKLFDDDDT